MIYPTPHTGRTTKRKMKMTRFTKTTRTHTARFRVTGATVGGVVVDITEAAIPEFVDGRIIGPKFDAITGQMATQIDVLLKREDGAEVMLHTKGGIALAIGVELEALGASDLSVGDTLEVTYTGDEDTEPGDDFVTKIYAAKITKATTAKD